MKAAIRIAVLGSMILLALWLPAHALTQQQAVDIVRAAGAGDDLDVTWETVTTKTLDAYFLVSLDGRQGAIVGIMWEGLPDSWQTIVLLHELGHYWQFKQDGWGGMYQDPVALEWAADEYSLRTACSFGLDPDAFHSLWAWISKTFDYDGDYMHGVVLDRLTNGLHKTRCGTRTEAP